MKIAIIGAGAAGCFCAVNIKRQNPKVVVEVFESGKRPLAKVAITGGGRCNITNSFEGTDKLSDAYPRGDKLMNRIFRQFDHKDTIQWWEKAGVKLITQPDNCIFPVSQDAMQVVNTLLAEMRRFGVILHLNTKVCEIKKDDSGFSLCIMHSELCINNYDKVIVTTGGSPKRSGLSFLDSLDLDIIDPVPSLFTFNIKDPITELMGAVVENASVKLAGTKHKASGPLLITHWGMSGPAILKLSSYAARHLAENEYKATLLVNWLGDSYNEDSAQQFLRNLIAQNPQKQISSVHPDALTTRIWLYIINKCGIPSERRMSELGKKQLNVLAAALVNDGYKIEGKSRYKDEFVTCGGVALSNIDLNTLEAKKYPGLYFAGEVLDVDAITGGFNLQAAWSMAWVIAQNG